MDALAADTLATIAAGRAAVAQLRQVVAALEALPLADVVEVLGQDTGAAGALGGGQVPLPFSRRRRAREAGRTSVVRRGVESDSSGTT